MVRGGNFFPAAEDSARRKLSAKVLGHVELGRSRCRSAYSKEISALRAALNRGATVVRNGLRRPFAATSERKIAGWKTAVLAVLHWQNGQSPARFLTVQSPPVRCARRTLADQKNVSAAGQPAAWHRLAAGQPAAWHRLAAVPQDPASDRSSRTRRRGSHENYRHRSSAPEHADDRG